MTHALLRAAFCFGIAGAAVAVAPAVAGANATVPANPASGCPGAYTVTGPGIIQIGDPGVGGTGTVTATYFQLAPPFFGNATVNYYAGSAVEVITGTAPGIGMLSGSYDRTGLVTRCDLVPTFFTQP